MSELSSRIDSVYLASARTDNPNASEEVVREAAIRAQKTCRAATNAYLKQRYPHGDYRPLEG